MLFNYEIRSNVVVDANTREEADRLLRLENYSVRDTKSAFTGISDEEGFVYPYVLNKDFKPCYYKPACPLGYNCVLDPARKEAEKCNSIFLTKEVDSCTSGNEDSCDYFDDEDK